MLHFKEPRAETTQRVRETEAEVIAFVLCEAEKLGAVSFATSCAPAVQSQFERGVALLHSFEYEVAEAQFEELATKDPRCAMATGDKR
jgi:hypothetical protein